MNEKFRQSYKIPLNLYTWLDNKTQQNAKTKRKVEKKENITGIKSCEAAECQRGRCRCRMTVLAVN